MQENLSAAPAPGELLAASDRAELSGTQGTIEIPLEAGARSAIAAAVGPQRIALHVEGLQADVNPGLVYQIYVDLPADATAVSQATYGDYFVGHLTFFGANHRPHGAAEHDGPPGLTHTYDITALVQKLRELGRWDAERVTVSFIPTGLLPPAGSEPVSATPAGSPRAVARIARVGIYRH